MRVLRFILCVSAFQRLMCGEISIRAETQRNGLTNAQAKNGRKMTALPPDVRRRLRLAGRADYSTGYALVSGSALNSEDGPEAEPGAKPKSYRPRPARQSRRLTSGGEAVTKTKIKIAAACKIDART